MDDHCQTLLATVPGIVYVLDKEGKFTFISEVMQSILGYSQNDLLGTHFSTIIHPEDVNIVSRKHVLPRFAGIPTGSEKAPKLFDERRSNARKTSELRLRLRARSMQNDGSDQILLCKVNAAGRYKSRNEGNMEFDGTIGIIYDITLDQYAPATVNIHKRYNVLDLLSQALSHAFSNVFTGIYGNLQLIEMHLEGKEEVVSNIDAIKNSVEKALVLINKMKKTISHVTENENNLSALIQQVADEVFSESKLEYKLIAESNLRNMEPDPDYIRHILRSVFYHIHNNIGDPGRLIINLSNLQDNHNLPRFDCRYLKVHIMLPLCGLSGYQSSSPSYEGCNDTLQKISTMALSYTLLKKTGAVLETDNSLTPSITLYIPAIEEQSAEMS
ncbi:MAG: PAS domain S-box protein [Fibrobacter sp.]|jgi:PAS domain S-box-containing protein|nr:PAS domain S-box protein [Fibrobacter sp.]